MKLFKANNGFIINDGDDKFITYIEHSIRIMHLPTDIGDKELVFESDEFKHDIKFSGNQLRLGYIGDEVVQFSYDVHLRELSCKLGLNEYKVPVVTRFQRWSDANPGSHLRMHVEAEGYDYSKIIKLDYVYYHGERSAEYDLMSITVLIPDDKFREFVLYALDNGFRTAISKD
jgi:hypothetical protein